MFNRIVTSIKIMHKTTKWIAILKIIFVLISAISVPLLVYSTEQMVNAITSFKKLNFSLYNVILWASIILLINFWEIIQSYFSKLIHLKAMIILKKKLLPKIFEKIRNIQYFYFENPECNNVFSRLGDSPHEIVVSIFDTTLNFLRDALSIIGIAFLFTRLSYGFFIVFLIILSLVLLCDYKSNITIQRMHRKQTYAERELKYYDSLLSNKYTLYEIKIMNSIKYIQNVWKNKAEIVLNEHMRSTIISQALMLSSTILLFVFSALIMMILLANTIQGTVSIGLFVSLVNSIQSIYSISYNLSDSITTLSQNSYQIEYFEKLFSMVENEKGTKILNDEKYEIIFEHVDFTYPGTTKKILQNFNLKINTNEKICIVGKNGAGKSTIIRLLCGLYQPDNGSIKINGKNINELSIDSLKKIRSIVFQDYFKYLTTIRENVSYGNIDKMFNDDEIEKSLTQAQAIDFVALLPNKIDTSLGNRDSDGVDLSFGQWQKIAIARACFLNSYFIILDEPTASLDPIAESLMYLNFLNVLKDKGYIFISHRLASAKMADRIIVIDDGKIIEDGSHEKLLEQKGLYCRMFMEQSEWYIDKRET